MPHTTHIAEMASDTNHPETMDQVKEAEDRYLVDSESESSDSEQDLRARTLDQIGHTRTTITLAIQADYSWSWGPVEAFREIVQNWRDAIVKSFNIRATHDFKVLRTERTKGQMTEVLYKVPHPDSNQSEWLGYILWKGRKGFGTVEVVNCRASLQPSHLNLGSTTKSGEANQAGAHGEGLKIALLVFQRGQQNHRVRCINGGVNWIFDFNPRAELVARLTRMSDKSLENARKKSSKLMQSGSVPIDVSPERDVQFIIGELSTRGRNEMGRPAGRRNQVSLDNFEVWCKAALFLQEVDGEGMIQTSQGDLITKESLRGNIYLKGLLLGENTGRKSASITGKQLKYGYNFAEGKTNRERQSITSAQEESQAIFLIWDQALRKKPKLITDLNSMMNSPEPGYADVSMANISVWPHTVRLLKQHLFSDETKWYYSTKEKAENPNLMTIIEGLGRQGFELRDRYWSILASKGLVRTADEEQFFRFRNAEVYPVPDYNFPQGLHWIIRACFHGCVQTAGVDVQFVSAGQLGVVVHFATTDWKLLKVHQRWLDMNESMRELALPQDTKANDVLFHSVREIFSEALNQLPDARFNRDDGHTVSWHRKGEKHRADQRMLQYLRWRNPSFCRLTPEELDSSLLKYPASPVGKVIQLHRLSRCANLKMNLLTSARVPHACIADGECFEWRSTPNDSGQHTVSEAKAGWFGNIRVGEEYFLMMLTPTDPSAIIISSDVVKASNREQSGVGSSIDNSNNLVVITGRAASVDIMKSRTWHKGVGPGGEDAVVGLGEVNLRRPQDEDDSDAERPLKRPRV